MMTILFLDFDGVLHPDRYDTELFCRTPYLWKILRACPHVSVVFSTAWREMHSMEQLVSLATRNGGEDLERRFLGITPIEDPDSASRNLDCRELECMAWLNDNEHSATPWLALDDIEDLFFPLSENLYLTNFEHGLTQRDVRRVVSRLNANAVKEESSLSLRPSDREW